MGHQPMHQPVNRRDGPERQPGRHYKPVVPPFILILAEDAERGIAAKTF